MRVIALVSGGKDSCYNMVQCVVEGHEIAALANLQPPDKDEMDSYMFQTVGYQAIELYAEAMGLDLFRRTIKGASIQTEKEYEITEGDEVEDMYELLKTAKEAVGADAVSVGAILSDYQRVRVENVCNRLGLTVLAYLWRRDQAELLPEMINAETGSIIIKVAAMGLLPDKHLSLSLAVIHPIMIRLNREYGLNICGEGGEYETFTLDCPLFKKRIVVDECENVIHSDDAFAPVGYVRFKSLHLEEKNTAPASVEDLAHLPIKQSRSLIEELFSPEDLQNLPMVPCHKESDSEATSAVIITPPLVKESNGHFWIASLLGDGNSIEESAHLLMSSLNRSLLSISAEVKDIYAVNLYMKQMSDYDTINSVYKSFFGLSRPVRVCIEADLPENIFLLMDVAGTFQDANLARDSMYVQGLSHWAPANIGPYSQAIRIDDQIFVAGQIGLCPATMKLIEYGIVAEARLSLRHVQRILSAMKSTVSLENVNLCICYVTNEDFIGFAQEEWNRAVSILDKEEFCEDSSKSLYPLVEFVVVPGLPKGALVEWHCRSSENQSGEIKEHKKSIGNCDVSFEYQKISSTGFLVLRGTILKMASASDENLSATQVVSDFFSIFDEILKENDSDWKDIPLMKIMYRKDCFDAENLRSVIYGCLEENYIITPFTILPVQRLTDVSCILCVLL